MIRRLNDIARGSLLKLSLQVHSLRSAGLKFPQKIFILTLCIIILKTNNSKNSLSYLENSYVKKNS